MKNHQNSSRISNWPWTCNHVKKKKKENYVDLIQKGEKADLGCLRGSSWERRRISGKKNKEGRDEEKGRDFWQRRQQKRDKKEVGPVFIQCLVRKRVYEFHSCVCKCFIFSMRSGLVAVGLGLCGLGFVLEGIYWIRYIWGNQLSFPFIRWCNI